MTEERIRALQSVGFKREEPTLGSLWSERFQQLREFKVQFGHCAVPQKYSANPKLNKGWVATQHNNYSMYQEGKPSPMTEERIRALQSVGFNREPIVGGLWSEQFQQLCEYKVQFGHCAVPQRYSANPKLRHWVATQRNNYNMYQEGKPSPMTEERIRALQSVGFNREPIVGGLWSEQFQQLCEYKVQFGHCAVPQRYSANPKLRHWVATQRNNYNMYQEGKPSPMTEERIRALQSVGFNREPIVGGLWSEKFQQLLEFKVQFGHCVVPQRYSANPKLGHWVATQRRNYKSYKEGKPSPMTEERIRELEGIGFNWVF